MLPRIAAFILLLTPAAETQVYLAANPGPARAALSGAAITLGNDVLEISWAAEGGAVKGRDFRDLLHKRTLPAQPALFVILLQDGRAISSLDLQFTGQNIEDLAPRAGSARASERLAGKAIRLQAADSATGLQITWRGVLRDGSNYIRQEVTLAAAQAPVKIAEVRLIDWQLPDAAVIGTVQGSPVAWGGIFAGFEHPLSRCAAAAGRARCMLERALPLQPGAPVTYSSAIGVAPSGQMRRAFLFYLERERAHPYRSFLHYNSWYDLGYFNKYDAAGALERVNAFGTELSQKRGVALSGYLFDDGWDEPAKLWQFNSGFPQGFTPIRDAAQKYGAAPGVWMSPWGGYGKPRQERVAAGRAAGYEIVDNGFALSGPVYYRLFHDTCLRMIGHFGINQFKFDGTGNANRVVPGSRFDSDFDAAIALIDDLRSASPDLYINLTTGTYPSPFWLRYADSIWRGGEDHSFAGVGSSRERWITYRDGDTYEHVVMQGPLYPLNSLMLHGLIYARFAKGLDSDPQSGFANEVRSYFGTGTQLQEMYITPSLLSPSDWDTLAEAANWSRANAGALVDSHWIGGDPAQLEVYGWAAWTPESAELVLRNPSDRPQNITLDVAAAFELPAGAPTHYSARSPWKSDAASPPIRLNAGEARTFTLKPFQVLTLDVRPQD
ncbi:MAG: enterotoxin [Acidobacteria bacterium]|nr:enterotoxin [Acidobacteriota bacterium]